MHDDLRIAQAHPLEPIAAIGAKVGLSEGVLELYGRYKAKVDARAFDDKPDRGRLVLVTAITPTPAGEGKTTVTVGLTDGMWAIGETAIAALREPSLGPCMGIKGGAAGGGHSQVVPMEDINLHFTGDMHAITAAHNLLAAMADNAAHHGTAGFKDMRASTWRRVLDVSDRALRDVVVGLGGRTGGVPRQTGFDITAASEVMAALCLSTDLADLKRRLGRIIVGEDVEGNPITAKDIGADGAMTALLKQAMSPNLVQTLAGAPALVHGGPFANIAHGTNSLVATRLALKLADFVITEAGFGADLGAEKFFDIVCRIGELSPSCVVLVATVRALKLHGGTKLADLEIPDVEALKRGLCNLDAHLDLLGKFGVPVVVGINRFTADTDTEVQAIIEHCAHRGQQAVPVDAWAKGGEGSTLLATAVAEQARAFEGRFEPLYSLDLPIKAKIEAVAKQAYGADGVKFLAGARRALKRIEALGLEGLPVCIAKTQKSLSDRASALGRPTGFQITIRDIEICAGAGFVVPLAGPLMRMPGLPKRPSALDIDIDADGRITGLR